MNTYDLVVVGLGAMGSSVLYHAAHRGLKALGIEQFAEVPHENGSHHGTTRVIRKAYFEHPGYVPLVLRAYDLWERLERETGKKLLVKSGGLMMGPHSGEVVPGALLAAKQHGLEYEQLTKADVAKRFPAFALDDGQEAVFEPDAGYLFSEAAVKAHVSQAVRAGAEIKLGCKVSGWSPSGDGIEVRLPGETVYTQHLVLTVGAWAQGFLREMRFEVERQVLHWFEPSVPSLRDLPIYLVEERDGTTFYGFPDLPEQGLKIALHHGGEICTADTIDRTIRDTDIGRMQKTVFRRMPALASSVLIKSSTCMYTNTPDYHFVIGPHPESSRVTLGLGYSGHGFKFSSAMGELLVNTAMGEKTIEVPDIFAPSRFVHG